MKKLMFPAISSLLILGLLGLIPDNIFAQERQQGPDMDQHRHRGMHGPEHFQEGFWSKLNDQQKQEVKQLIQEMRESGADPKEIHEAVRGKLTEYGIELPEKGFDRHDGMRGFGPPFHEILDQLNEEQQETLESTLKELREQKANPIEVHAAIEKLLTEWGVELPDRDNGPMAFWKNLTDEQKQSLLDKIKELRANNTTPKEIHEAVTTMLKEWGIEIPDFRDRPGPWGAQLTAEQREGIHALVQELRDNGATPEEIHEAVSKKLEEFGIEKPEFRNGKHRRHGLRNASFWNELTTEQKQAIHDKIRELREQGATPQEIHNAVSELLKGFGIDWSEDDTGKEPQQYNRKSKLMESNNFPNPFNPETKITYTLKTPGDVTVKIYNTQGQLIRILMDAYQPEGTHSLQWDGLNEAGQSVVSGVYFYQIKAGDQLELKRMMLIK